MGKTNIPGPQWYMRMNKLRVERDLEQTNLEELLGDQLQTFIKFAANQRFEYKENIHAEYKEFINRKRRLADIDPKSWAEIRREVFKRDNYTCQYCDQKGGNLEVDHIIPFSKGGKEIIINLVTSCKSCNCKKHDKTPEEAGMKLINAPRGRQAPK